MAFKRLIYYYYEKLLEKEVQKGTIPTHVGLILDGNRRYAKEMGFQNVNLGHREGAKKLDDVLQWCVEYGVRIVTIWGLSTENVGRDEDELKGLVAVIKEKIEDLFQNPVVRRYGFRIKVLGNLHMLPDELREVAKRAEDETKHNKNHVLNIAIGYGGRQEIVEAVKKAIRDKKIQSCEALADSITVNDITSHLYTNGIPDPDLIIRTSGEVRLSGFLLWQSAYSEFYFCDALWPAFRKIDFLRAIRSYQHRHRRYGK
jgi:short-chain Z-isoprenyl diphosphate synthase